MPHTGPTCAEAGDQQPATGRHRGAWAWVQETRCAAFGHEYLLHSEDHRIYLECALCGHQTTGWRVEAKTGHGHA